MNQYLFVYPHREYFYTNPGFYALSRDYANVVIAAEEVCKEMRAIIDSRYRSKGYQISWLLFSDPLDYKKPDMDSVEERVGMHPEDKKLVAGISFEDSCRLGMHFDPDYVLVQLSSIQKLVLGGFHQADCVDKLASAAHKKGIDVSVDEDTTNSFLSRKSIGVKISTERQGWSLADFGMTPDNVSEGMIEDFKAFRRDKPWLVKVQ